MMMNIKIYVIQASYHKRWRDAYYIYIFASSFILTNDVYFVVSKQWKDGKQPRVASQNRNRNFFSLSAEIESFCAINKLKIKIISY